MQISLTNPKISLLESGFFWKEGTGFTFKAAKIVEELRLEACSQYAFDLQGKDAKAGFTMVGVVNSLLRRLAFEDPSEFRKILKDHFATLVGLEDFGLLKDRKGYIPRESRITILLKNWGRFSGALPIRYNESPDAENLSPILGTIGNLTQIPKCPTLSKSWELKQTYYWEHDNCRQDISDIERNFSGSPLTEDLEFYEHNAPGYATRKNCWRKKASTKQFTIARSSLPRRHYWIVDFSSPTPAMSELARNEAMLYLLWLDSKTERRVRCNASVYENRKIITVPKYYPQDWEYALKAASSDYTDEGSYLKLEYNDQAFKFVESLLKVSSGQIKLCPST